MARRPFGGGGDTVVLDAETGAPMPFAAGTAWTARTGGTQITDLTDESEVALPASEMVTDAAAALAPFLGPADGTQQMWADFGGGARFLMTCTDMPDRLATVESGGTGAVPTTRTINTTAPLTGGGALSGNLTLGVTTGTTAGTVAAGDDSRITDAMPKVNTLVVAANGSGIAGDYQCDGTADDVQIQAAYDALQAGDGGHLVLTAGTFNLAALIAADGFDDVDTEQDIYIRGQGSANTTLVVGSGVAAGIRIGKSVRVHISDLGLVIDGASHGIQAVHSTTPAALLRSAWFSTIARVQVIGPFDGGDTGWPLLLENVFRASIRDVEVNGTTNGMRWYNATSAFNAGDSVIERVFIDLGNGGNNGVAYDINSNLGNMNQMSFDTCHSIANSSATGTVAWRFTGAGNTSHVRLRNCNVEQFVTTIQISANACDIEADFVHVTQKNGSTFADVAGFDNRISCGLVYVEPGATVTVIDDSNGYDAKPNVYSNISGYVDTGGAVTVDLGDYGVLRDSVWDGDTATIAAALRKPPGVAQNRVVTLTDAATIATDASMGNHFRVTLGGNRTLGNPTGAVDGQKLTFELVQDGSGSRTITLDTKFAFGTDITSVTLSTTASKRDFLGVVYNATLDKFLVLGLVKGF